MKRRTIAIALIVLLGGCAAPGPGSLVGGVSQAQAQRARTLPGQAWMDAGASSADLVYVSNADGEVTVYNYSTKALVGVLAAFETPRGECVDKSGNLYVVDAGTDQVYEYAHGGTKAIKTLDDSPYEPNGCAVDSATGNLAVANSQGASGSAGSIAVYAHASGTPTVYTSPAIPDFAGCAYNDDGSLLTTGYEKSSNDSLFAWLPKHGNALVSINVPGPKASWTWYGVTGIQWDGEFLVLDDGGNGVYQIALIHGQAYWVNQTLLTDRYIGGAEYGIYDPNPKHQGTEILAGYIDESYSSGVYYFPYPGGGSSTGSFSHGVDDPFAIAISLAK
jgi:hypothetical protein